MAKKQGYRTVANTAHQYSSEWTSRRKPSFGILQYIHRTWLQLQQQRHKKNIHIQASYRNIPVLSVGFAVGSFVGGTDGCPVGLAVGLCVGLGVGGCEGCPVGR